MGQVTSAVAHTMRADAKAMVGAEVDTTPLLGTWINAKRNTENVAKAVLTKRDGDVFVRLYGTSADGLVDWGETEAAPYAFTGTNLVAGFHARYALGSAVVNIAANVKQGILVIQTYSSFRDDSGRMSQFSREFFYQSDEQPRLGDVRVGRSFLAGDWVNTKPDTKWIRSCTLADTGHGYTLRVQGAGDPADWGETDVDTFLDSAGDPAFHAEYDLGSVEVALAGNTGKNLIIIAAYLRFRGDESANAFCREFFVPR